MDWHEIALGAIGIIAMICGWVWVSTTRWLGKISEKLDAHVADDSLHFASVLEKMNEHHIETLNRISGRWAEDDRKK